MTFGRIYYFLVFSLISTTFLGQYAQEKTISHGGGQYTPYASPQKVIVKSDGTYFFNGLDKGEYRGAPYQHASYFNLNEDLGYLGNLVDYPSEPTFSGPSPYYFPKDMQPSSDNGVLLYMHSDSLHPSDFNKNIYRQPTLIKLDSTGNEMWRKRYPDFRGSNSWSYNTVRSLFPVAGGYLVVNEWPIRDFTAPNEPSYGEQDLWLMKVDTEGNQLWVKHFGGSGNEQLLAAVEHENGNVCFLLKTNSMDYDLANRTDSASMGWYLELEAEGEIIRNQSLVIPFDDNIAANGEHILRGMTTYNEENLMLYGRHYRLAEALPNQHDTDIYTGDGFYCLYNLATNQLSEDYFFGGSSTDYFNSGKRLSSGNIGFGGYANSKDGDFENEEKGTDAWFLLTDENGNILQQLFFNKEDKREQIVDIMETTGDDIICLASINYIYKSVYWVLKLSKNTTGLYEVTERKPLLNAYPNPNKTGILQTNLQGDYKLIDTQGRIVARFYDTKRLDLGKLTSGVYTLHHNSGATQRVVIE